MDKKRCTSCPYCIRNFRNYIIIHRLCYLMSKVELCCKEDSILGKRTTTILRDPLPALTTVPGAGGLLSSVPSGTASNDERRQAKSSFRSNTYTDQLLILKQALQQGRVPLQKATMQHTAIHKYSTQEGNIPSTRQISHSINTMLTGITPQSWTYLERFLKGQPCHTLELGEGPSCVPGGGHSQMELSRRFWYWDPRRISPTKVMQKKSYSLSNMFTIEEAGETTQMCYQQSTQISTSWSRVGITTLQDISFCC